MEKIYPSPVTLDALYEVFQAGDDIRVNLEWWYVEGVVRTFDGKPAIAASMGERKGHILLDEVEQHKGWRKGKRFEYA